MIDYFMKIDEKKYRKKFVNRKNLLLKKTRNFYNNKRRHKKIQNFHFVLSAKVYHIVCNTRISSHRNGIKKL